MGEVYRFITFALSLERDWDGLAVVFEGESVAAMVSASLGECDAQIRFDVEGLGWLCTGFVLSATPALDVTNSLS